MAQRSVPWRPGNAKRSGGYTMPKAHAMMPKIKTWNSANVHAVMPDFTSEETSKTGVAGIKGNLTANYPKIRGWNGGVSGQGFNQPLVTETGIDGYY